jgi:hypothetical protein
MVETLTSAMRSRIAPIVILGLVPRIPLSAGTEIVAVASAPPRILVFSGDLDRDPRHKA